MLDMRQGILWREWRHQDSVGRVTKLRETTPGVVGRSPFAAPVGGAYPGKLQWRGNDRGELSTASLIMASRDGLTVALATASRLEAPEGGGIGSEDPSKSPLALSLELGKPYRLDRVVAVCTSRDHDHPADSGARPRRACGRD